jgi:hypothetical protein
MLIIDGPPCAFGDNMSVLHNTSEPESLLKKMWHLVAHHHARECVAMEELLIACCPAESSLAHALFESVTQTEDRNDQN